MTSPIRSLLFPPKVQRSNFPILSIDEWAQMFSFGNYPLLTQTLTQNREEISQGFRGLVAGAYYANGIIFACIAARMKLLSEARFMYQRLREGRPGDLWGDASLRVLERPEPGKTTADLLARASVDLDLAGNWFAVRRPGRIKRLQPDWVTIMSGSPRPPSNTSIWDVDTEVVGYVYTPGGPGSGNEPEFFDRDEVAHVAGPADPLAPNRGVSWLTPIIREIMADSAATLHKLTFFERGATPNMVVTIDKTVPLDEARQWFDLFEQEHSGVLNAYKTIFLGGGAATNVVGANLQQMDFKVTQGAGETRIASVSGMHPVIVGFSEGLQGSSLNAGNFAAARRLVGDKELRPWWRNMAGSLETIVPPPSDSRLWYDARDIPFLAEDVKDAAEILRIQMQTVGEGIRSGFEPDATIDMVSSGDMRRLMGQHSGFISVQMQDMQPAPDAAPEASVPPARWLPLNSGDSQVRCGNCNYLLAELASPPYRFTCRKCKSVTEALTGGAHANGDT